MRSFTLLRTILLAAALVAGVGSAGTAMAQSTRVIVPDNPGGGGGASSGNAVATANVNVRQGPGTNHRVVDVLQRGDSVRIVRCQSGWCQITHSGAPGWVSRNYLRDVIETGRPGGGGGNGGINIGGGINISIGGGNRLVCFFERADYRGPNFCARPGESDRNLGTWGRRIMSIRVDGRTTVDVCTQRNFGNCSAFSRSVPVLNRMLQNNIGSYRVHR